MKKNLLILLITLVSYNSIAQQKGEKQLSAEFDKMLSEQFKPAGPGATALVARNGQVIYRKAFGMANVELDVPMQIDNVFRIGSISKQFTAVAILQLMEQGKLDVKDDIKKYIPDYPTHGYSITIEHLLTHTAGTKSYTDMKDFMERMRKDVTPAEMIDHFKGEPMEFAPGTKWNYNNSAYFLLGYIIEKLSGKTYPQYVEENFFKPLGMASSLYGDDAKIVKKRAGAYAKANNGVENAAYLSMTQPYAAGSLQSTVDDLFKWHKALHSYKLLKKETLEKAFVKYKLSSGKETNYGYGWFLGQIMGSPTIEHGGGINGFLTMSIYLPREDVFVAVFSNCECNPPTETTAKLAALAIGKPYFYKEIKIDPAMLKEYTGVFENEEAEQRFITLADGQLFSQRSGGTRYKITAYEKDKFFFESLTTNIEFMRNAAGTIDRLAVTGRTDNVIWKKTDKPLPQRVAINVEESILKKYLGDYELAPAFILSIIMKDGKLFGQATRQDAIEIFAETETKFFAKAVDAQIEFIMENDKVSKLILTQGGTKTDAKKIK